MRRRLKTGDMVLIAALLLGLWHALLLAGEAWPWWLLGIAGLGAIAWRKGVAPRRRHAYRIEAVEPLARGAVRSTPTPSPRRLRIRACASASRTSATPATPCRR